MSVKMYHNPNCSKSRASLELLAQQANGEEIEIIHYLETPPSAETLLQLCQQLACHPLDIIRSNESLFQALGLSKTDKRSDAAWCQLMADNPILIERPIVVRGDKVVIGRPPERVLSLY